MSLSICLLLACTGFYVGRNASADGTTLLARTVDSLSTSVTKRFELTPRVENQLGRLYRALDNSVTWPLPATTYRAISVPSVATKDRGRYDGSCVNEKGLMISATVTGHACAAAKEADPYVKDGFGEGSLPGLLMVSCATAREAVALLGEVIAACGHTGPEIYYFADPNETWCVEVYTGHQWAAMKLPEDAMYVSGNIFLFREFDPKDPETMCSKDLLTLPEKAGFLKRGASGLIDLAETYAAPITKYASRRTWRGQQYFAPSTTPKNADLTTRPAPFFKPDKKVSIRDLEEVMRWRYEGTPECPEEGGDPATIRVIGVGRQCACHVLSLDASLPPERCVTMWTTLSNAEHSPFMPLHVLQTRVGEDFSRESLDGARFFQPQIPAMHFRRLSALAELDRKLYGAGIRAYWRRQEDRWLREFPELVRAGDVEAITAYSVRVQEESLASAKRLFDDLSWYITRMNFKRGDYATPKYVPERVPFVPEQ